MNDPKIYRLMKWAALLIALLVVGSMAYEAIYDDKVGGGMTYREGHLRLEEGKIKEAYQKFEAVLSEDPDNPDGYMGIALALMAMEKNDEALAALNKTIELRDFFAPGWANRGVLKDRMGDHKGALLDYRKALALDKELGEGRGWMDRILRNHERTPSTIAERANYIEAELKKPVAERKLQMPELDKKETPWKLEGPISNPK